MITDIQNDSSLAEFFDLCLKEDCPEGDITSLAIIPLDDLSEFKIVAKEPFVFCGSRFVSFGFRRLDPHMRLTFISSDGALCQKGTEVAIGYGHTHAILKAERPILNLIARLSAIATYTRKLADIVSTAGIKLLDTRKTTPLLRSFEKYAVKTGGGYNHRLNMSDEFLIKENHLYSEGKRSANPVVDAIKKCRSFDPSKRIVLEIEHLNQIPAALDAGVDRVMLDNMSPEEIKKALSFIEGRIPVEISGGIDITNIKEYCIEGVNFISMGSLTHSIKSVDMSLLIKPA